MRAVVLSLSVLVAGCACGPETSGLIVELRTDLVPGVEFHFVRVDYFAGSTPAVAPRESNETPARFGDDFFRARRVADFARVKRGRAVVRTRLLDSAGSPIAERLTRVDLAARRVVTVVITRNCRGAVCPGPSDPADAVTCVHGRCVPPECVDGTEPVCDPECATDVDCPPAAECAAARCLAGSCVAEPTPGFCALDEYCDPDLGCLPRGLPPPDAGPPDAGPPPIDAGPLPVDAGPLPMDAGPLPMDAGPLLMDSGPPPPPDSGPRPRDTGPPRPPDAGPRPPDTGPPVCTGCTEGGVCHPGTAAGRCGFGGNPCSTCPACTPSAPSGGVCSGGDSCGASLDISALGVHHYPIDTCPLADDLTLSCGAPGARDVVLSGDAPAAVDSSYLITAGPGWVISLRNPDCVSARPGPSCQPESHGVYGREGFPARWYFVVERADGSCGRVDLVVDRRL